jgi:hypothetical protein
MISDSEMLKVKKMSSRNAGSGSTIMAMTAMTSTGTPKPLRANSPNVANAARMRSYVLVLVADLGIGPGHRAAAVGFNVRTLKM